MRHAVGAAHFEECRADRCHHLRAGDIGDGNVAVAPLQEAPRHDDQGQGLGRACVRLLKRMAFRDLHAHRFWLDVKQLNVRALALYASEGFVEEGRLRESVRVTIDGADGYDSLIVMSLLDREYQARVALGLELHA